MKKIVLISLIVIIWIISFTFIKTQKPANDEVVFWTLQMSSFSDYMNGVIKDFEKENPDIKIKWIDVPFSEGEKRTLASILSDNPPDLINLNPNFTNLLAQRGALYEIETPEISQFNTEILEALKVNDKLYSIPWYATSAITIYNKDLVKKADVNLPKTFEDLGKIAPQIKSKTGSYVYLPTITENDTMAKILHKYGVNSSDMVNSQKSAEVFNFFKDLYQKDLIPKETVTLTHSEALEKYMAEKIVFFSAGANFLNMIKENAPSTYKNTDVAPQITGSLGQNDFSLMNFIIPQRAKHKEDALKFALFLTNDKNQLELAKLTNIIAVNEKTLKNDFYTKYDETNLMSKARVISAKQLNKINPVMKPDKNQKEVNILINSAVQEILLDKSSTEKVLNNVAREWKALEQ